MMGLLDSYMSMRGGLLSPEDQQSARDQAITALGASLLAGKGTLGGILGNAVMNSQQVYGQAQDSLAQRAMRQAQLGQMQRQEHRDSQLFPLQVESARFNLEKDRAAVEEAKAQRERLQQAIAQLQTDPRFASDQGLQAMIRINPAEAIKRAFPERKFEKIFNPQGQEQGAYVAPGQEPQFIGGAKRDINDLIVMGPDGKPTINTLAMDAKKQIAAAGKQDAPRIDIKMGDSIAQQVGPILKASRDATAGAVSLGDAAGRVVSALDKGSIYAGPGASWMQAGAQVADALGVAGKDTKEKIVRTREVIRGLAESSIEARKELAGQGQVTENEAKAVDKAISGNIDDLTPAEIRLIAGLNQKRAALKIQQHKAMLEKAPDQLRPFYDIQGAPSSSKTVDFNSLRD